MGVEVGEEMGDWAVGEGWGTEATMRGGGSSPCQCWAWDTAVPRPQVDTVAHNDRRAGRRYTTGSPGSHWPPGSGCSRSGPRHSRIGSLGKVTQCTEALPFCCMPCPVCPAAPKLTMKSTGIVQSLFLAPGDVDGHWEL